MYRPKFRQVERQASRMHEMMERLDVDAVKLVRRDQGEAYAKARTRCLNCGETEKCLRWLSAFEEFIERPEFCPNLDVFKSCAQPSQPS